MGPVGNKLSRWREGQFALILVAVSVFLAAGLFGAAELGIRLWIKTIPELIVPSGVRHPQGFLNPGVVTTLPEFGFHIKYHINLQGLRGPAIAPRKGACRRILIIGDSVVFGAMVQENETLSVQLEQLLNSRGEGCWEVLNGGTPGVDLWDYEGTLRLKGLAFEPDIVVIGLYMNDHISMEEYDQTMQRAVVAPNRPYFAAIRDVLFHSKTLKAFMYLFMRDRPAKAPIVALRKPLTPQDNKAIDGFFPGDDQTAAAAKRFLEEYRYDPNVIRGTLPWMLDLRAWERIKEPLAVIQRLCRRRNLKLMAATFPVQFEVFPGYRWPEPHRTIAGVFRAQGVPLVEMRPVFAVSQLKDELYRFRYDTAHPSRQAYALAAQALLARLDKLGWTRP